MPEEILNRIFYYSNIRCHVYWVHYYNGFYKKQGHFYYCSLKCYETI